MYKGVEISVTESWKMTISIGKLYVCDMLCNIVEMDVFHLLLVRPWKFYVGTTYDCRANVYSLEWKGKWLQLLPNIVDSKTPHPGPKKQVALHVVTGSTLIHCWRQPAPVFAFLIIEFYSTSSPKEVPKDVQALLQ